MGGTLPPSLVIVSGPPASGKTSLGREIALRLQLPFFTKDAFKEMMADQLQVAGLTWSQALGATSFELLFMIARSVLEAGQSAIIEGNFNSDTSSERFRQILGDTGARVVQVSCHADGELLLKRYEEREAEGKRHPIHVDGPRSQAEAFRSGLLRGYLPSLEIGGQVIQVDTTEFDNIDIPSIVSRIRQQFVAEGMPPGDGNEG